MGLASFVLWPEECRFRDSQYRPGEDTLQVMPMTRVGTVEVTADGEGLVSHTGAELLVELADGSGLTGALSEARGSTRERQSAHDPGRVLRDVAVMLADGGDCVTDIRARPSRKPRRRIDATHRGQSPRARPPPSSISPSRR